MFLGKSPAATIVRDNLRRVTHHARQKDKLFPEYITRQKFAETQQEITRIQQESNAVKRLVGKITALLEYDAFTPKEVPLC